jgi:carboxypeptidase T
LSDEAPFVGARSPRPCGETEWRFNGQLVLSKDASLSVKNQARRRILLSLLIALFSGSLWPVGPYLSVKGENTASSAASAGLTVIRIYVKDRDHLNAVAGRLDIWEAHPDQNYVVAAVSLAQYRWLQDLGYQVEVDAEKTIWLELAAPLDPRFYYFDSYYPNANGRYVVDFLHDVNTAYPTLTELYDAGDAWLADQPSEHDRDIWVLRVTNEDLAYGDIHDKPAFFLFATIHAREVAVPELAIRYIKYLTEGYGGQGGYGQDADVTWLVNHNVAYVLVMQNPDGHSVNEQNTAAYWRKNMDNDDGCSISNWWGVDLNRNHSFMWGCCAGGSSPSPCDETYRGPSPASEPETQAFQDFFATVMCDQNGPNGDNEQPPAAPDDTTGIFISLHSYGDQVLWPWGFSDWGPAPNDAQLATIGRKFADYNGADPTGTIWYTVDGATDDWAYGKFGVASYTFEVGPNTGSCGGFFPAYGCIDGIDGMPRSFWAENKPALLYAHKIARTPYMTSYGPDVENVAAFPATIFPSMPVSLTATVADHRYGGDPLGPIAGAEYFVDAPGEDGTGFPLSPVDGAWGGVSEAVMAVKDTAGLALGQHYLLVHGRNSNGDWGPFTAVFLTVVQSRSYFVPLVTNDG